MNTSKSILFLDIDDVLCLNQTYGGYDVIRAMKGVHPFPDNVYRDVFDQRACQVLVSIHSAMAGNLEYVISSTWREVFDEAQMREVFRRAGIGFVGHALHERWCTPVRPERGRRADDIAAWLDTWHQGEAFAIVDDGPRAAAIVARRGVRRGDAAGTARGGGTGHGAHRKRTSVTRVDCHDA